MSDEQELEKIKILSFDLLNSIPSSWQQEEEFSHDIKELEIRRSKHGDGVTLFDFYELFHAILRLLIRKGLLIEDKQNNQKVN